MGRFNFNTEASVSRQVYTANKSVLTDTEDRVDGFFQPIDSDQNTVALGLVGQAYQFVCEGEADIRANDVLWLPTGIQLVDDSNMEQSGVDAWTVSRGGILTKESENGNQVLRVTRSNNSAPGAAQQSILTVGSEYRVTGRAKSNGVVEPRFDDESSGSVVIWSGTNSTDFQDFDEVFTASTTDIFLRHNGEVDDTSWAEFDDIFITEIQQYRVRGVKRNQMKRQDFKTVIMELSVKE